jgi:hypothetical protein
MSDGSKIIKSFKRLEAVRAPLDQHWREAFQYSFPIRGQGFFAGAMGDGVMSAGLARTQRSEIYDTTGAEACRLLANSLIGGLTPKSSQWFALSIPDVPDAKIPRSVRSWLQSSSETMYSMIHSSNYDAQAFEFFLDVTIAGMAGLYVERNEATGRLHFECWPLDSMYVMDSDKSEKINTLYRRCAYTLSEAVAKFGLNGLSAEQQRMYDEDPDNPKQHHYIHTIRPRFRNGRKANGKTNKQLPFESTYVCESSSKVVYESGYHEFPVIVPRWSVIPNTEYAVGPFTDALPDVKTLNEIKKLMLTNASMAISGSYVAQIDTMINTNTFRVMPGSITYVEDVDHIKPLSQAGDFRIAENVMLQLRSQIKQMMMSDELAPSQQNRPMTAEEVRTRTQIIRQILGPTYGRLQAEFLNPLISRVFGLAYRGGDLGQPPEELAMFKFVPEYKSPLARAQRFDEVAAMDRFEAALAQSAQVLGPQVLDLYDADMAVQKRAEMLGIPVELMREDREVEAIRKQRADAQAAQQQQEQQMQLLQSQGQQLTKGQTSNLVDQVT